MFIQLQFALFSALSEIPSIQRSQVFNRYSSGHFKVANGSAAFQTTLLFLYNCAIFLKIFLYFLSHSIKKGKNINTYTTLLLLMEFGGSNT